MLLLLRFLFRIWTYFFRAIFRVSQIHPGLILVPVVIFFGAKLYWANFASATWRQELKLEVETPHGVVHGSSIAKLSVWHTPEFMQTGGQFSSIVGEAVAIDLGEGKWLFALLDNQIFMFKKVLSPTGKDKMARTLEGIRLIRQQERPLLVKFSDLPTLLTFSDINDPDSMLIVDPDDLASVFGDGYTLRSATVQATDNPVTDGQLVNVWRCLADADPCLPWNRSESAANQLQLPWDAKFQGKEK